MPPQPEPKVEVKPEAPVPPKPGARVETKTEPKAAPNPEPKAASLKLAMPGTLNLQAASFHKLLPIKVTRAGCDGPVVLTFDDVPEGVTINEATIEAGKDVVEVEAWAAADTDDAEKEMKVIGTAGQVKNEFLLKVKIKKK